MMYNVTTKQKICIRNQDMQGPYDQIFLFDLIASNFYQHDAINSAFDKQEKDLVSPY